LDLSSLCHKGRSTTKTLRILQLSHFVPAFDTCSTNLREDGPEEQYQRLVGNINLVDLQTLSASADIGRST